MAVNLPPVAKRVDFVKLGGTPNEYDHFASRPDDVFFGVQENHAWHHLPTLLLNATASVHSLSPVAMDVAISLFEHHNGKQPKRLLAHQVIEVLHQLHRGPRHFWDIFVRLLTNSAAPRNLYGPPVALAEDVAVPSIGMYNKALGWHFASEMSGHDTKMCQISRQFGIDMICQCWIEINIWFGHFVCVCVLVPLQLFAWFSLILRTQAHIPAERIFFWDANLSSLVVPISLQKKTEPARQQRIISVFGGYPDLSHLFSRLDLSLVAKLNKELLVDKTGEIHSRKLTAGLPLMIGFRNFGSFPNSLKE